VTRAGQKLGKDKFQDQLDIVSLLINFGAKINDHATGANYYTPLIFSVTWHNPLLLEELLAPRSLKELLNTRSQKQFDNLAKIAVGADAGLRPVGADVGVRGCDWRRTALHLIIDFYTQGSLSQHERFVRCLWMMRLLVSAGADTNHAGDLAYNHTVRSSVLKDKCILADGRELFLAVLNSKPEEISSMQSKAQKSNARKLTLEEMAARIQAAVADKNSPAKLLQRNSEAGFFSNSARESSSGSKGAYAASRYKK
jgi:hypothetical protein